MPFGISDAPQVFRQRLDEALDGIPGVHTIADDILITGVESNMDDATADHDRKLHRLLQRCRSKGICIKLKFRQSKVTYREHLLTTDGLKLHPSKLSAKPNTQKPTDVHGVQRMQRLVNYSSRFLSNLTDLCEPLRQLTHNDAA